MSEQAANNSQEIACPDCSEMVRKNALRCWNCGAFMNPELELKFMEMQANPAKPILSVPEAEISSLDEDEDDDDFELTIPKPSGPVKSTPVADAPASSGAVGEGETAQPASPDAASANRPPMPDSGVDHSVATGGDALLDIAMQEERANTKKRRKRKLTGGTRTAGGGLIIFCPYGCHIEVKEDHRGMTGRCPKCRAPFFVPIDPPNFKKKKKKGDAAAGDDSSSGKYATWLDDLHLHSVNPEKLKLKADSLLKDFAPADFGFSPDDLLVAKLAKKAGGLFGGGDKNADPRQDMRKYLAEGKPFDELPATEKHLYSKEDLAQIKVVQPAANRAESMFHGIPIFGEGRIAVQLPFEDGITDTVYVSMGLTEFWEFNKAAQEQLGIENLGEGCGIPPEHVFSDYKCHYTDATVRALENLEFYKADGKVKLVIAGYRCGTCGLAVGEDGRKKENLGGKTGKGIAKAKCPKCEAKMGDNPLYTLESEVQEPSMAGDAP